MSQQSTSKHKLHADDCVKRNIRQASECMSQAVQRVFHLARFEPANDMIFISESNSGKTVGIIQLDALSGSAKSK